jgi:serralysin
MATVGTIGATGNKDIDGLLSGYRWNGALTYSFPDSAGDYSSNYGYGEPTAPGFAQVSAAQQSLVHAVMRQVADFTNLTIEYAGTNGADLRIAQSSEANPTAYAYYPGSNTGGDIWFGTSYNYRDPKLGDYYAFTHTHEIGHALGLKHSHEGSSSAGNCGCAACMAQTLTPQAIQGAGSAGASASIAVPAQHDAMEYTVMSYRSYVGGPTSGGYTNETYGYATTFMMNDIRALQEMYGADFTTRGGDTVYSWSATTGEFFIDGVGQGRPGGVNAGSAANVVFMTVWDGGGNDTYDFSNYTSGLIVDLNPGACSITSSAQRAYLGDGQYAKGCVYNSYLYNGDARSYIENVIGGSGNDILIGNAVGNRIDGGAGNDTLTGGGGADIFVFRSGYGADIITDFSVGFDQVDLSGLNQFSTFAAVMSAGSQVGLNSVFNFGYSLSLTLTNVALASLSAADFIVATPLPAEPNTAPYGIALAATHIDENLAGGAIGALSVSDDTDHWFSFVVSDERFVVSGEPGAYVLKLKDRVALDFEAEPTIDVSITATDGGGLSFTEHFTIHVNDLAGVTITGTSGRDTINGERTVIGQPRPTQEDDIIHAGAGNDVVSGLGGNDLIYGGAGDDILYGDAGNDRIIGGLGADRIYGGEGDDVIVIAGTEAERDIISGGFGTDTIEVTGAGNVTLSKFSAEVASIEVWAGNGAGVLGTAKSDFLDFSGLELWSGLAFIDGGSGDDAIHGTSGDDDLRGGSGNDLLYGGGGNDRLTGGSGSDILDGGQGDDTFVIFGSDAVGDTMRGGDGVDAIEAIGAGPVTLSRFSAEKSSIEVWNGSGQGVIGTRGNDTLDFSGLDSVSGLPFIDGGAGNDTIIGTRFDDVIRGGSGNDLLTGGAGDDLLTGGSGNDSFFFGLGFGHDVITDFSAGKSRGDVLVFDKRVFGSLEDVLAASQQVGANVVVTASPSDTLTLQNVLLSNLHANDVGFV